MEDHDALKRILWSKDTCLELQLRLPRGQQGLELPCRLTQLTGLCVAFPKRWVIWSFE